MLTVSCDAAHLEGVAGKQRGERGRDGREALQRFARHDMVLEDLRSRLCACR